MRVFAVLAFICVCVAASPLDEWVSFKAFHGKKYSSPSEEHYRLSVFLKNKALIEEHNNKFEKGLESFRMKMNHFGDLTEKEFNDRLHRMYGFRMEGNSVFTAPENVEIPDSVDWREKGAVTPVKNQGNCGSCWAFSTTGSLEGQTFLKTGKLVSLSEQNLIDCSGLNAGCGGGTMENAFMDISTSGGIDTEESYPYEGEEGECRFSESNVGATASGYKSIESGDEDALKKAVATVGPVSIGINAGTSKFQFYSQGVYVDKECPASLNHGVLAVGYGTENGQDYWIVKNSWGPSWGDNGYIKMARNNKNQCGISSMAGYPIL